MGDIVKVFLRFVGEILEVPYPEFLLIYCILGDEHWNGNKHHVWSEFVLRTLWNTDLESKDIVFV